MTKRKARRPAASSNPKSVAILGLGPSMTQYLNLTKRQGGRAYFDETWGINAIGDIINCDRVIHMDDVRVQEIRAAAKPDSNIAAMLKWLKKHPGPILTSRLHPGYPGLVEFPLEDIVNEVPNAYFNSTAAYAVAYAIHLGFKKIACFGMDFTYPNVQEAEKGRACVEFWLGVASARGIELAVPKATSLMDSMFPQGERFYGYDCVDLSFGRAGKRITVNYSEKAEADYPTAAAIEDRYDHSKHPNPMMAEEK